MITNKSLHLQMAIALVNLVNLVKMNHALEDFVIQKRVVIWANACHVGVTSA
jgi:hypothetical protein